LLFTEDPTKVLLADDHPLIVLGLKNAIRELLPLAVFYEAIDGDQAYQLLQDNKDIDLAIVDVNMPKMNGLSVMEKANTELNHQAKSIILTLHKDPHYYEKGKEIGIRAYLLKEHALSELEVCLSEVLVGQCYLSPAIQEMLDENLISYNQIHKLDGLERQLLKLIGVGKSTREISEIMVISSKSTSKSMSKICHKLEIPDNQSSLKNWVIVNKATLAY